MPKNEPYSRRNWRRIKQQFHAVLVEEPRPAEYTPALVEALERNQFDPYA